jgi:RHS repeat-associated protein
MNQRIPHTELTSNKHAAAYGYKYDGFAQAPIQYKVSFDGNYDDIKDGLWTMMQRGFTCSGIDANNVWIDENFPIIDDNMTLDNVENDQYFYHTDHLGSSSWITNNVGDVNQHLQYLPFGESFIDQRTNHDIRFKFTGKERDAETGFDYFGARYYASDLSVWLSVDPLNILYPQLGPYAYVANNPIKYYDPDGKIIGIVVTSTANKPGAGSFGHMAIIVGNDDIGYHIFSLEDPTGPAKNYIKEDEIIFEGKVAWPESIASSQYVYYSHSEKSLDALLVYMSNNAPGTANKIPGGGYDRMAILNNVTPEQEKAFYEYMKSSSAYEDFIYEFTTNNCSSHSIKSVNDFFGNVINDKSAIDIPNKEFDKLIKDTKNWSVYEDAYNYSSRGGLKSFINNIKSLFKSKNHSKHGTVLYL